MKKPLKIIGIITITVFLITQFFQPSKNKGEISSNDILRNEAVSVDIQDILKNSCYDCHSNQTRYLWYHKISPVSLMINHHIEEGKKELNFSE